jgi:hypothetical protein
MPYKRIGKKIYVKRGNKWVLKQRATSIPKAKSTMNLLYGLESGEWIPTGKRKKYAIVRKHKRKGRIVKKHRRKLR